MSTAKERYENIIKCWNCKDTMMLVSKKPKKDIYYCTNCRFHKGVLKEPKGLDKWL